MTTVTIDEQIKTLEQLVAKAQASERRAPAGIINVMHTHGRNQYLLKESPQERPGKYLAKDKLPLAAALVQRDYDREFICAASAIKKKLLQIKKSGCERNISFLYAALADIYERSAPGRKALIKPYVLPDALYIKEWEGMAYRGLSFSEDAPEIYSERGERVRSKSEKMIADKLLLMKLPYRYECPANIERRHPVYPDFTILDVSERRAVIYEHFGMMQDEDYARDALLKIRDYQKAGFQVGRDFLYTMESSDCPLNMRNFEKMMRDRFFE